MVDNWWCKVYFKSPFGILWYSSTIYIFVEEYISLFIIFIFKSSLRVVSSHMISTKLVSLFVKNRNFWDFLQWEDHPETTLHFRYEKKSPPPKAQEKKILINTYTIRENHNTQFLQWNNTRYLEKCWKKKRMLIIISLSWIEFKIVRLSSQYMKKESI